MYKKCYAVPIGKNKYRIHLWDEGGYNEIEWHNPAYQECSKEEATHIGLGGEPLKKIYNWVYKPTHYGGNSDGNTPNLHFHDIPGHQKFLIEQYGTNDEPSIDHRELFFDIECEIGGALTEDYIERAPMPITTIAYWDKTPDKWVILVRDDQNELNRTKAKNKEIVPCQTEKELLAKFLEHFREIDPDILVGYNSDYSV